MFLCILTNAQLVSANCYALYVALYALCTRCARCMRFVRAARAVCALYALCIKKISAQFVRLFFKVAV